MNFGLNLEVLYKVWKNFQKDSIKNLAIPLVGIYPKEMKSLSLFIFFFKSLSLKDICTPMLIAALSIIAKSQKQLK